MLETVSLDPKTILIKSDNENDLAQVIDFIFQQNKKINIQKLFKLADENRVIEGDFKFVRDDCYE